MKDGPLGFPIVPHKYGVLAHHLEVGTFPSDFRLPSVTGLFLRAHEELVCIWELVDAFKTEIVYLTSIIIQVQGDGAFTLGIDNPPDVIDLCIIPPIYGFVLCVDLEVGIDWMISPWVSECVAYRGVKNGQTLLVVCPREYCGGAWAL